MSAHNLRAIILGCGSSGGVPRVGGDWGVCDPEEPRNRRSRCSLYVEYWQGDKDVPVKERTAVLIDTSPDLRQQFLSHNIKRLDAVLYTHDHADQTHGIDDLRAIAYRGGQRLPTFMDAHTKEHVFNRFEYCFDMPDGRVHPPILELQPLIRDGDIISIDGPGGKLNFDVLEVSHGPTPSLGFKIDNRIAYIPDVWDVPDNVFDRLEGIDCWIVDGLRYNDHPTHANADKTLAWIARAKARRGIITNLHIDMDYRTLRSELPPAIEPAFDGMEIILC